MSLEAGRAKVTDSFKELVVKWQMTKQGWNDVASRQFEQEFLAPMEQRVRAAVGAMEQLGDVVRRVNNDCT